VKVTLALLGCLVLPACTVADLSGAAHDVDARDTQSEAFADSSDGAVGDTRSEVTPDVGDTDASAFDGELDAADSVDVDDGPEVGELDDASEGDDVNTGELPDASLEVSEDTVESSDAAADAELVDLFDGTDAVEADSADIPVDVADTSVDVADTMADIADTTSPDASDTNTAADTFPLGDTSVACNTVVATFTPDPSPHVQACSVVTYPTNPPTSGPHYPIWAAFKAYASPVNPGFLVHSMEHGAVVIHYRCDDVPCDGELAELATFLAARPSDPLCVEPVLARVVTTPSLTLDTRFAVSAWGASLRSDCFDLEALATFLDLYYAKAPEDFCSDGVDLDTVEVGSALYCPPTP